MTLPKKGSSGKRADPPRLSDYTKQFLKAWEALRRSGRYNMGHLKEVMLMLIANDGPPERRDHALTGDWADHRECPVGGDFLLIYRLEDVGRKPKIIFVRAGTHSELFEQGEL